MKIFALMGAVFILASPGLALTLAKDVSQNSIYEGEISQVAWKDENKHTVQLSQWKHKKILLAFGFTSCKTACPLTIQQLKRIKQQVAEKNDPNRAVLFITLDPELDTEERLYLFKHKYWHIEDANWHFLRGDISQVRQLAKLLDFDFTAGDEHPVHDRKDFAIDENGKIEKVFSSWKEDVKNN